MNLPSNGLIELEQLQQIMNQENNKLNYKLFSTITIKCHPDLQDKKLLIGRNMKNPSIHLKLLEKFRINTVNLWTLNF